MKRIPLLPSVLMLLFMALAIYAFVPHTAVVAQTVPTRTPTPGSGGGGGGTEPVEPPPGGGGGTEPVNPPPGGGGGTEPVNPPPGGGGGSEPVNPPPGGGGGGSEPNTPVPTNTPTPRPVNIAPTPIGGFVTPEACGDPLFVASRGPVNVRQGPGTNYALLGELVFLEGRPIIGRAENAAWWLILLADDSEGWVANSTGTVYGYGTLAPLVAPPLINGATATPGVRFQPTPNSDCAIPPTATATATPANTVTSTPTAEASEPKPESLASEAAVQITPRLGVLSADEGDEAEPDVVAEVEPTATPPQSPTLIADNSDSDLAANSPSDNHSNEGGGGINWFLFGGLGFILLGLGGFAVQRFGRS